MYKNMCMNTELYIYTCTYTHLHEGDMKRYSSWLAYGWIKTWLAYTFFNTTLLSGMILNGEISVLDSIGSPMFQKARLRIWFCLIQHLHMYLKWVSWCLCVCAWTHMRETKRTNYNAKQVTSIRSPSFHQYLSVPMALSMGKLNLLLCLCN